MEHVVKEVQRYKARVWLFRARSLSKLFGHVDHDILMNRLSKRIDKTIKSR